MKVMPQNLEEVFFLSWYTEAICVSRTTGLTVQNNLSEMEIHRDGEMKKLYKLMLVQEIQY